MVKIRLLNQIRAYGKIYLHSMPGRYENIIEFEKEVIKFNLNRIICLTSKSEIKEKSPEYYVSVEAGKIGNCQIDYNPVADFSIPVEEKDILRYESILNSTYQTLKTGSILIHCAGGVGRTGTFAIILLRILGYPYEEAKSMVLKAGSKPENQNQWDFCEHYRI